MFLSPKAFCEEKVFLIISCGGCQTWEVFVSYCSPCPSRCAGFAPEPEMRRALGKSCYRAGGWLVAPYMVPPKKCPGKSDLHPPG